LNFAASSVGGNLTATATTLGITQAGALTVGGNLSATASTANQTISLASRTNTVRSTSELTTSGATGDASIKETSINFATTGVGGNLTATATTGGIVQAGALTVGGNLSATASTANQTISLASQTNTVSGTTALTTSGATGDASI